jgi:hypothetical protein
VAEAVAEGVAPGSADSVGDALGSGVAVPVGGGAGTGHEVGRLAGDEGEDEHPAADAGDQVVARATPRLPGMERLAGLIDPHALPLGTPVTLLSTRRHGTSLAPRGSRAG